MIIFLDEKKNWQKNTRQCWVTYTHAKGVEDEKVSGAKKKKGHHLSTEWINDPENVNDTKVWRTLKHS